MTPSTPPTTKTVLVTTGATHPFTTLLDAILSPSFLTTLHNHSYTDILIQHGLPTSHPSFPKFSNLSESDPTSGIPKITAFQYTPDLPSEMAKAHLIIAHAGSGTILEALRLGKRLVVVPNGELMDNHQVELARELGGQGYLVDGRVENLSEAVERAEKFHFKQFARQSAAKGQEGGFGRIVDEEMGWANEG